MILLPYKLYLVKRLDNNIYNQDTETKQDIFKQ